MPEPTPDESRREPPTRSRTGQGGRDRLFKSLFRPTRRQLTVGLLLALVGFAGVTQVRANEVDDDYAGLREQDLIDVLNGLAGARQRAEAERDRLEEARADLSSTTSRRQAAIEQAATEADTLSILAGLVPVTGSGIRITIERGDRPDQAELHARRDPGAAHRRRRGHPDQRRRSGSSRRPRSRTSPAASSSTAS